MGVAVTLWYRDSHYFYLLYVKVDVKYHSRKKKIDKCCWNSWAYITNAKKMQDVVSQRCALMYDNRQTQIVKSWHTRKV
jgi:hypothetical protein